jgi:hypothetical protein
MVQQAGILRGRGWLGHVRSPYWLMFARASMVIAGLVLVTAAIQHYRTSRLDRYTSGTVIGIERLPSDSWDDRNYLIGYQFLTDQRKPAAGTYLLENPPTLGEMPRMGSYLTISYSSVNPSVNQPWNDQGIDLGELFLAEFLAVVGVVLLVGGVGLR